MEVAVLLLNPKFPHNVSAALRSCALLGARQLYWTGERVPGPDQWPEGARLPREERMRCYARTTPHWLRPDAHLFPASAVPVCVEISDTAMPLDLFDHPPNVVYVFGPEDGSVTKGVRGQCHFFVRIPNAIPPTDPDARTPYNLAQAVQSVLLHRLLQQRERERLAVLRNFVEGRQP
jgi:tRNA(Leu) C34 or U34 (ribose-2'-O)-methylase TrmL